MDYEALRAGLQAAIPYNNHVGLEYVEVATGKGVVRLPDAENLKNHVGSQHAGALFSPARPPPGAPSWARSASTSPGSRRWPATQRSST